MKGERSKTKESLYSSNPGLQPTVKSSSTYPHLPHLPQSTHKALPLRPFPTKKPCPSYASRPCVSGGIIPEELDADREQKICSD